jgi:hypothetical protein
MSQTRTEAFKSCEKMMNEYHHEGWILLNDDFYHPEINRNVSVDLKKAELDKIDGWLMENKKVDLQKYLEAMVNKLKNSSKDWEPELDDLDDQ